MTAFSDMAHIWSIRPGSLFSSYAGPDEVCAQYVGGFFWHDTAFVFAWFLRA